MKAIIDGKLYDTETAEGIYWGSYAYEDFYICRTGNNKYFIEYENKINLVTEEWAKTFIEILDIDKYIELFGEVEEG